MAEENEELSCDISKYHAEINGKARVAVTFVGKDFPATEHYLEALGKAYDGGFFGDMEMAVMAVDNEECDKLAEHEGVEEIPKTVVYSYGKVVGTVVPNNEDAKIGYRETIKTLIDLSED